MLMLELMLAALLAATLVFGWRLERKLRALKDSQAGFVKAMGNLDGAAARAQAGLETLRRATDEAQDALVPRIAAAERAAARLDQLTGEAEMAAKRAEAAAREVEASAGKLASAIARPRPEPAAIARPHPEPAPPLPRSLQAPAKGEHSLPPPAEPRPRNEAKRSAADFAAMLAAKTTRQPLPAQSHEPRDLEPRGETKPAGSRLREAAALLRGG